MRKLHPRLPAFSAEFTASVPLTRIRDIAHRNDIPQALKVWRTVCSSGMNAWVPALRYLTPNPITVDGVQHVLCAGDESTAGVLKQYVDVSVSEFSTGRALCSGLVSKTL